LIVLASGWRQEKLLHPRGYKSRASMQRAQAWQTPIRIDT
jgi:hypothetical protein